MNSASATRELDESREGLTVLKAERTEPLSKCVRSALRFYLRDLDGYEVNDLHQMVIGEVERPMLETVLEYTKGNQTQTAKLLGMSRSTLRKKIAHYGVGRPGR